MLLYAIYKALPLALTCFHLPFKLLPLDLPSLLGSNFIHCRMWWLACL